MVDVTGRPGRSTSKFGIGHGPCIEIFFNPGGNAGIDVGGASALHCEGGGGVRMTGGGMVVVGCVDALCSRCRHPT